MYHNSDGYALDGAIRVSKLRLNDVVFISDDVVAASARDGHLYSVLLSTRTILSKTKAGKEVRSIVVLPDERLVRCLNSECIIGEPPL